jgi:hypothetical protein
VRRPVPRPLNAAILIFLLVAAAVCPADTLLLHDPSPRFCLTSPDAQYLLEDGSLTPQRGMFSLYGYGEQPLEPRFMLPPSAQPGNLLQLHILTVEPVDTVSAEVSGPGGRELSRSEGFRARADEKGERWDILLGIPAGAAARAGALALHVTVGQRSCLLLQPLTIRERAFFSEQIPFGRELTALVTSADPRKAAEYQALLHLLKTPHPEAQYETGPFLVPLPTARRTSNYGDRREYLFTGEPSQLSIHQGVDLAAPTGSQVPACGRGRVVFAGRRIISGNTVILEHQPGLFSLYFHLSALRVAEGDIAEKGQVIGQVGMTGLATGPHLHWEVDAFTTAVDPDALTSGPLLDTEADF